VSAAQSRARQRQRRHARERFWKAQQELAERQLDVAAYRRVLAHMAMRSKAEVLLSVDAFRDEVLKDCERLENVVAQLKTRHEELQALAAEAREQHEEI
jgi:hypothetical protein